jgi:hypothetical protein
MVDELAPGRSVGVAGGRVARPQSKLIGSGLRLLEPVPIAVGTGLVAFAICCYQLALPRVLLGVHGYTGPGYDDGVYFGAAVRLVHGVVPYRDFVLVHPPGIVLLASPEALLSRLISTRDALGLARLVTAAVVGLNALLAALAVRSRGPLAAFIAGAGLALFPLAVTADHTLMLEPYLVAFCLGGTVLTFGRGEPARGARLAAGGALFGVALSVKVWALFPIVAALLCLAPKWRSMCKFFVGVLIGVGVVVSPFFVLAPGNFVHDVIGAQADRIGLPTAALASHLLMVSGIQGIAGGASTTLGVTIIVAGALFCAVVYALCRRCCTRLDWFALVSAVVVTGGMLLAVGFRPHYAYFTAPFIVLVAAVSVSSAAELVRARLARRGDRVLRRRAALAGTAAVCVAVAVLIFAVLPQELSYSRSYLSLASDPAAAVDARVPAGSCVILDEVTAAIVADRFVPGGQGCPTMVDPFGTELALDPSAYSHRYGYSPAYVAEWIGWLERADYVVLAYPRTDVLPWTPALVAWFASDYRLVHARRYTYIYRRTALSASRQAAFGDLAAGIAAERDHHLAAATADFRASLKLYDEDEFALYDLGTVEQVEGRRAAAVSLYRRALRIDPRLASAWFNLAIAYAATRPQLAARYLREVLRLRPSAARARQELRRLDQLIARQGSSGSAGRGTTGRSNG